MKIPTMDVDSVRNVVSFWLRRFAAVDRTGGDQSPYVAAIYAVENGIHAATDAKASLECVFGEGVEFGIKLAACVVANPFGGDEFAALFQRAIDETAQELTALAETAREDRAIKDRGRSDPATRVAAAVKGGA